MIYAQAVALMSAIFCGFVAAAANEDGREGIFVWAVVFLFLNLAVWIVPIFWRP